MTNRQGHVEIVLVDEDQVEIRFFDVPGSQRYRAWGMSMEEARDLVAWWKAEGVSLDVHRLPLGNVRFHSLQISIYAPTSVHVQGFDSYGRQKMTGWTLPPEVVEGLLEWFAGDMDSNLSSHG